MRLIIVILLTIVVLYYSVVYPLRNRGEKNWFMVAVTLIILIPCALLEFRTYTFENIASKAAVAVSHNPKSYLHCERVSEGFFNVNVHIGYVSSAEPDKAVLNYNSCKSLFTYIQGNKDNPSAEEISAVHTLAHEAWHTTGEYNEAVTECASIQLTSLTAQKLGATQAQGDALTQQYWETVYTRMPAAYTSTECSQGGTMDLTPDDGVFP